MTLGKGVRKCHCHQYPHYDMLYKRMGIAARVVWLEFHNHKFVVHVSHKNSTAIQFLGIINIKK